MSGEHRAMEKSDADRLGSCRSPSGFSALKLISIEAGVQRPGELAKFAAGPAGNHSDAPGSRMATRTGPRRPETGLPGRRCTRQRRVGE